MDTLKNVPYSFCGVMMSTRAIKTTVDNAQEGLRKMLREVKEEEIVILPLAKYEALLSELEDLKDLQDHKEAMQECREGKGRPFREFIREHKKRFDI